MMSGICTKFPNLYRHESKSVQQLSRRDIQNFEVANKPLLLAWASLLSAYSGKAEEVVFLSNHGVVKVHVQTWHVERIDGTGTSESSTSNITGLYFGKVGQHPSQACASLTRLQPDLSHHSALELFYEDGAASLLSYGHVPSDHLEQLEFQLRDTIRQVSAREHISHDGSFDYKLALSICNDQPRILPGPRLLHQLVNWNTSPTHSAVEFWDSDQSLLAVSYSKLYQQSGDLAARICDSYEGHSPSTQPVIPLFVSQSSDLYVAMIAVLRAGCAFCPIQLDAPPDRIEFILRDVSASSVITTPDLMNKLPDLVGIRRILLDKQCEVGRDCDTLEVYPVQDTDCAYVMYTSGSTGQPKGVSVSHRAATQSLLAHDHCIPQFSRFLQFAAPTFDVSLFEIFFTLFRGCTLVGCNRSNLLANLPAAMRRMKVDAAELTPTVAAGLLQRRANVPSLKLLLTIGEMLTPPVIEEFGSSITQESILWGMYGPTEAAIHCTLCPAFRSDSRASNIGFPLNTVSVFILAPIETDDCEPSDIKVLPLGLMGELAVGGHQLADGYLNRPEQTAKSFIDTKEYGRLYRTGDKARMLPDYSVECLGRISSGQVKLRGQRIELGEIQYAATRTPGCRDAIAMVIGGTLVAFCLTDSREVSVKDITTTCRQWLPTFMVPGDVVLLTQYPCLASGKVDRAQLEKEYSSGRESNPEPTEEIENEKVKQICEVLTQTLGRQFGPSASLASSGLDSLSAIQAAGRLHTLGISVSPIELLSAATANELLAHTESNQEISHDHVVQDTPESTEPEQTSEILFLVNQSPAMQQLGNDITQISACTPLQLAMLAETAKDPTAYCNMVKFQFPSWCKPSKIEEHLQSLVSRNAILRSGFCRLPSSAYPFALVTWKALSPEQLITSDATVLDFKLEDESSFLRPLRFHVSRIEQADNQEARMVLLYLHHALYDGWSIELILNDLNSLVQGELPEPRPQFHAVVDHYKQLPKSLSLEYWQEHMHDFRPNAMPRFNGQIIEKPKTERQDFSFESSYQKLQESARAHNIGPQVYFQAALAYILHTYLGNPDITIGTVTSGRMIAVPGVEAIIGPCVVTLPLRVNVSHSKRVADLLKSIQALNRRMLHHTDQPLRAIKHACGLTAAENIWDVLFVWQETLESRKNIKRAVKLVDSSDKLESIMTLEIEPRGSTIFGKITYRSSHVCRAQVQVLFKQIDALVTLFADEVNTLLSEINPKVPIDVLSVANPQPEIPNFSRGLAEAVENHARTSPDDRAVMFAPSIDSTLYESLTYRELNDEANRVAHLLQNHLGTSAELVCICMEKSLYLYVAILAVLKTGRGYLPITPATPMERIKIILKEADFPLCLTDSLVLSTLNLGKHCKTLSIPDAITSHLPADNLNVRYDGSRIAYAVFTSGSTGTPKGVLVTQQNLLSNLKMLSQIYPSSSGDRLLQACSQAFDVSCFEIFFSWYVGICFCSATNDVLFYDLEKNIRAMKVTHLSLTPTVAALVDPKNVPGVRFLVTAGEAVTEKVKQTWAGNGLYQGYGPSETTNICTVKSQVSGSDVISNIGPPLKNTSAFVCDPASNDILPLGAIGELCFGGDQVFRGYLNNEKLTTAKIINHKIFGRLYKSGDTGRLLPDGSILFTGRIDDQIKIRGQRVELGEINQCLLRGHSVLDCVTMVFEDKHTKSTRLVAFVVTERKADTALSVVPVSPKLSTIIANAFADLEAVLPSYMIPSALVPITFIPMTAQGKVDKRALRSAFDHLDQKTLGLLARNLEQDGDQRELTQEEYLIAQALSRTVNVPIEAVKRHTSFFNLGLDSVSAISLSKALQEEGKSPFLVSTILKNPTVARLAKIRDEMQTAQPKASLDLSKTFNQQIVDRIRTGFAKKDIDKILPCTPLQESMLSSSASGASSLYCNTLIIKVPFDITRLQESWTVMASRHELLRTCFISTDDLTYPFAQVVLTQHTPNWAIQRAENEDQILEIAKATLSDQLCSPLHSHEPPYFLRIIQSEEQNFLQFSCHHALQDGAATSLLLREIELYCTGQPLPDIVPYEPFLQEMIGHRTSTAVGFWTDKLRGFHPILLSSKDTKHGHFAETLRLPLTAVEKMCKQPGTTLLSLSQAAWSKVLLVMFGQSDVCFGNVVSGRTLPVRGLENLIAPTFNTLPVRIDMERHRTNEALLRYVQQLNADSLTFQLTPLRKIQSDLGYGGSGIFSTLLLLQQSQLELDSSIWTLEEEFGEMDVS
jgi:amino acid adenylation domain-containing protein